MKQYKAISLIETLISLTIVSIAIIALIPSVTVKNKGENYTYGNASWNRMTLVDGTQYYSLPDTTKLLIGSPILCTDADTPATGCYAKDSYYYDFASSDFIVDTTDFKNSRLTPLAVTGVLNKNGTMVRSSGTNIHFFSGTLSSSAYPLNLFVNSDTDYKRNRVVVDMSTVVDNYSLNNNYAVTNRDSDINYCSIDVGSATESDGEQLYVAYSPRIDADVEAGVVASPAKNLVAIGRNVGKCINFANSPDSILIFNGTTDSTSCSGDFGNVKGLAIGKTAEGTGIYDTGNWNYNNLYVQNFVIHKIGDGATPLKINANLKLKNGIDATTFYLGSDKRLKNVIGDYKRGLSEILKIKPVEYIYKNDEKKQHHIGVIAQDIKKLIPEAVKVNQSTKYYMVDDDPIFYAVLNALKELNAKNVKIEQENKNLEKKIAELKKIKARLQASQGGANE